MQPESENPEDAASCHEWAEYNLPCLVDMEILRESSSELASVTPPVDDKGNEGTSTANAMRFA